jgi:hypothetical protein
MIYAYIKKSRACYYDTQLWGKNGNGTWCCDDSSYDIYFTKEEVTDDIKKALLVIKKRHQIPINSYIYKSFSIRINECPKKSHMGDGCKKGFPKPIALEILSNLNYTPVGNDLFYKS